MKIPAGQTIEECIRDDARDVFEKSGRMPRLAYMVNPRDAAAMLARLPFVGGTQVDDGKTTWFEMHTDAGYVRILTDPNHPTGATQRFVICCKCGGLAMYMPGVDLCTACLGAHVMRPYAPGEKMTDRHPDSVIAQVVEETIDKRVAHLATPIKVRSPYAPLPPPSEPAFRLFERDGALFVDTKAGPVKITADPTVRRNEVRLDNGVGVFHIEPDPPDLAQRQAARVAEHQRAEADRLRPPRPDGFDQHRVDAAKAALLVQAPPRYPRPR